MSDIKTENNIGEMPGKWWNKQKNHLIFIGYDW